MISEYMIYNIVGACSQEVYILFLQNWSSIVEKFPEVETEILQ